jgi:integrase
MADGGCVMTNLRSALADYLELRRGLGFSLDRPAKLLAQFVTYLEDTGASTITIAHALTWAGLPKTGSQGWLGQRMSVVRGFATYLRTLDPTTEVPPFGLLPGTTRRAVPYLYSDTDILALFAEAERLRTPLRTATIQAFVGLMTVTGMRGGEVVGLDDGDFDPIDGVLHVRHAKFGKARLVPLHPSTVTAIEGYRAHRDRMFPSPVSPALLVSRVGTRLHYINVGATFHTLVGRAGLAARSGSSRARPHDVRH